MRHVSVFLAILFSVSVASAAETLPAWVNTVPAEMRAKYRNPDGSCVQCSISMAAAYHGGPPAAETLLWASAYGPAVRGGSHPGRVEAYATARNIPIHNITGSQSLAWLNWALRNGRNAAIIWGSNHMITAVGISPDGQQYAVCDNNSPTRVQIYPRAQFLQRFLTYSGGGWCVILDSPVPTPTVPPSFAPWWNQ